VTRVCVVGSGGREHALAAALDRTAEVVVTPGNPGIPWSTPAPPDAVDADLYVIGPEVPLVEGLADRLRAGGRLVFGPGADGARLEGSKAWMKDVLVAAGVPTAPHRSFGAGGGPGAGGERDAVAFVQSLPGPYVVKTDGLAAGKGVLVTADLGEAIEDLRAKLAAGVVVEAGLRGPEVSLMCLTDGHRVVPLASAQDHKRVGDGDTGPNTGGMGAFSPVPAVDATEGERLCEALVAPTLHELRRRGIDYRGVLYAGLMLTSDGPAVLEYNVRFGDPEAQVVLPRLEGDVTALLAEAAAGALRTTPTFRADAAVTVVCASEGYPAAPRTGDLIDGLDAAAAVPGVTVYCAGVGQRPDGRLVTAGGRVLAVTGTGATIDDARRAAYHGVGRLSWPGRHCRSDIAAVRESAR
jgi:phosphoribosylamine--glycine ligase